MTDLQKSVTDNDEDALINKYLTFLIGEESFGIELKHVMEIVGIQPITNMPEMPDYIKGLINLRGKIISVMDVRLRFELPQIDYNDRTCIIVINLNGTSVGLIVDSVSEVLKIPEEEIAQKPAVNAQDCCGYIKSIGKVNEQVILLIDCKKLLNVKEAA